MRRGESFSPWGHRSEYWHLPDMMERGWCLPGLMILVLLTNCRDGADSDQRRREEDFYYTEVQVKEEAAPESAPSPSSASSPIIIQQALAKPETLVLEQSTLESHLPSSALSQSAPSSFWHIQADHAYQVCWVGQSKKQNGVVTCGIFLRGVPLPSHVLTNLKTLLRNSWRLADSSGPY